MKIEVKIKNARRLANADKIRRNEEINIELSRSISRRSLQTVFHHPVDNARHENVFSELFLLQ